MSGSFAVERAGPAAALLRRSIPADSPAATHMVTNGRRGGSRDFRDDFSLTTTEIRLGNQDEASYHGSVDMRRE
jgi:hypothetical protein